MLRARLLVLMLILGLPFVLVLTGNQAGAVDLFPSQVCNSQSTSQQTTVVCQQKNQQQKTADNPVITALKVTIDILSFIVGVSVVIVLVLAGLRMVTASGNAQGFATARNSIIYSLVGLALVLVAQAIVVFVLDKL